jgi:hypothetical protein
MFEKWGEAMKPLKIRGSIGQPGIWRTVTIGISDAKSLLWTPHALLETP